MAIELYQICGYLRDILTFRNYIEVPDNKDSYFTISEEELRTGKLVMSEERIRFIKSWCKKEKNNEIATKAPVILILKVVSDMIPKYTSPRTKSNDNVWEYKRASLVYVKAEIDRENFTIRSVKGESLVWADPLIRRAENKFLSFLRRLISKIFGKKGKILDARFCLEDGYLIVCGDDNWRQYIDAVDKYFEKRCGKGLFNSDTLTDDQGNAHNLYVEDEIGQTIVMKDDTVFAAMHIVSLLTGIENESDMSHPLFKNMVFGRGVRKRLDKHRVGENVEKHLGQMKNDFPLADAQRDVVHCFSNMGEGDVLAVSGPPGTGKTTMLQSIVADMVVKGIAQARKSVPFILASSSNNKAITNIIDAFNSGKEDASRIDMHHRWLCYESAMGERFVPMAVYCPSFSVDIDKLKEYFVTDTNGGLNYGMLRNRYYQDSSDFYGRASKALGFKMERLEEVKAMIDSRINSLRDELDEIGQMISNKSVSCGLLRDMAERLAKRYDRKFEVKESDHSDELPDSRRIYEKSLDRLLDMTLRFDLYWMAVHYNECRWIEIIEKYRERSGGMREVYGKFLWDEIRYICPCVVSTFYMAPKLFEYSSRKYGKSYNYGLADLLIVDEAGQVSPEIGLPTFALAKRALVVGDVKQIPPVYSVPSCLEEEYWEKRFSSKNGNIDRELLSCCQSSIMAIAESRSVYERRTGSGQIAPGLFLNEHRRCVDEIIAYSNALVYNGDLEPKRGSHIKLSRLDLPPLGFFQSDSDSETKDGSRFNRKEIKTISEWLRQNADRIETAYSDSKGKRKIYELVSIITPFKAQSNKLKGDEYLKNFPIGTVHTFQGAESPIVIFSLVYGKNDNPVFIKNNHELMNVAVSRAKDHFLIFGNRECLESNSADLACRLLHEMSADIK